MTAFEFVDELPAKKYGREPDLVLMEFAEALRANPKRWAVYPRPLKSPASAAHWINHKTSAAAFRDGVFEATERHGVLYVRYVGGES